MSPTTTPDDGRPSFAAGDDVPAPRNEQLATMSHEHRQVGWSMSIVGRSTIGVRLI